MQIQVQKRIMSRSFLYFTLLKVCHNDAFCSLCTDFSLCSRELRGLHGKIITVIHLSAHREPLFDFLINVWSGIEMKYKSALIRAIRA